MTTSTLKTQNTFNLSVLRKVFSLLATWEKWIALVLVLVIAGSLYWNWKIFYNNHTVPAAANGGEVIEGMIGQPHFINPILATTATDQTLVHAVFSGLYRYNGKGELVPDLATDWPEIGNDSKHYTVHLKPDLTWHDGKPLTADDVVFTISQIQNAEVQSPLRNLWLSTSVRKLDPLTVVFVTKEVSGPFLHNLTVPLLPEHAWSGVGAESFSNHPLNTKPLGSGPFAIREIEKNPDGTTHKLTLKSFAGHPRKPKLDAISLVFYNSLDELQQGFLGKEIDTLGLSINDAITEPESNNTTVVRAALPQYQAIFLNTTNPAVSEQPVRQALRLALDSTNITKAAWGDRARPIYDPPLGLFTGSPNVFPANTASAEDMLDKAGWTKKANGIRTKGAVTLEINLLTSDTPTFTAASELIAKQWQSIGISVKVKAVPTAELISEYVRPRRYDALLFSQRAGADPDPFAFWHSGQTKDPGLNVSNFVSSEADSLITDARTRTSSAERQVLYNKLADILRTSTPAIYLNQSLYTYITDKEVQGMSLTAFTDPTWRLSEAPEWHRRTERNWK